LKTVPPALHIWGHPVQDGAIVVSVYRDVQADASWSLNVTLRRHGAKFFLFSGDIVKKCCHQAFFGRGVRQIGAFVVI